MICQIFTKGAALCCSPPPSRLLCLLVVAFGCSPGILCKLYAIRLLTCISSDVRILN
ncbi:hypothetical protein M434DRAFT_128366 [Hypoxylon sp. CO27-5]|nr:hypothetical protein M434DRAFT_128366 [Hypoxylon sp. CO27-5]